MNAPAILERAQELDEEIHFLDRLFFMAVTYHAHPKITEHIAARRNDVVRRWGAAWDTRPVERRAVPRA